MKSKTLVINIVIMVLLNLLVKPFYVLGIDSQMINKVGEADYGYYLTLMMWGSMFMILADLGVNQYASTELSSAPKLIKKYFFKLLNVKIILMVFYSIFMILLFTFLDIWHDPKIVFSIIFNQILIGLILYIRSLLGASLKFKSDAIVSISDKFFLILIMSYLMYFSDIKIQIIDFIWAQSVAYLITLTLSITLLSSHLKIKWHRLTFKELRHILKKSTPMALLILLMGIYQKLDVVMIERILPNGAYWSGEYAKVYRLFEAIINFPYMLGVLLLPLFSKLIFRKQNIYATFKTAGNLIFIGLATLIIAGYYGGAFYFNNMFKNQSEQLLNVWYLFIPTIISMSYIFIYGTMLTSGRNLKKLNTVAFIGLVSNLLLNASLIPIYGIIGAAIATLVTQLATLFLQVYFCQKIYLQWRAYQPFAPLLLFIIGFYIIYEWIDQIYIGISISIVWMIGLIIYFKMIQIKDIKNMISNK